MPPVAKKSKKQTNTAPPPASTPNDEPEKMVAISGQLDKKMKKSQARIDKQRGIVLIRHLPHGFFEDQLRKYFEQFGTVTRLRLARSKRTGGSKGFAFVEFDYPEVAKVAAETMHNYLMFQRIVKAQYIPPTKQIYNFFKTSVRKVTNKVGKSIYVSGHTAAVQKKAREFNDWSDENCQKRIAKHLRKLKKLKEKYAHLSIDFDNFVVKPNILTVAEQKAKGEKKVEEQGKQPEPGSILRVKKRKQVEKVDIEKKSKKAKPQGSGKKLELKDLLENTLQDEGSSEDEEFIPTPEADEDEDIDTSDEESYGIALNEGSSSEEEDDDEEEVLPQKKKKTMEKIDRMSELIKRKPHAGGIQKLSKKPNKDKKSSKPTAAKNILKVAAAKEIKQLGKMKQMKKIDLNKTTKKQKV